MLLKGPLLESVWYLMPCPTPLRYPYRHLKIKSINLLYTVILKKYINLKYYTDFLFMDSENVSLYYHIPHK